MTSNLGSRAAACCLLALHLATSARATAADDQAGSEDPRATGVAAVRVEDWPRATTALQRHLADRPDDADARVLLGVALHHQGRHAQARAALRRAIADDTRLLARARYYLGLSLWLEGDTEAALAVYQELMTEHPESPEAERVATWLVRMEDDDGDRDGGDPDLETETAGEDPAGDWTTLFAQYLFQHSSNPQRLPELTTAEDVGADQAHFLLGYASVAPPEGHWSLALTGFWQDYLENDQLDFSGVTGRAALLQRGAAYRLSLAYEPKLFWLEGDFYEHGHEVVAAVERRWSRRLRGHLEAGGGIKRHPEPADEALDGWFVAAEAGLDWRIQPDGPLRRVRLEVGVDQYQPERESSGWRSFTADLRTTLTPAPDLDLDGRLGWRGRSYLEAEAGRDEARSEGRFLAEIRGRLRLHDHLTLEASARYIESVANVAAFEYQEVLLGAGIGVLY